MNILDRILEYKREFVADLRRSTCMEKLREQANATPPTRGFADALRGTRAADGARTPQETLRVAAEVKKASPSKGVIRADFDPAEIARSYEAGGASAISVLTDEKFFQGGLDCLRAARAVTSLPILRKEFIIDEIQILEARAAGADCVLLIAGLLDWPSLGRLRDHAAENNLDVLLEIHGGDELDQALALSPDVLGVNNRNLRTKDFHTDLAVTEGLMDRIPPGITLISESGIRDRADIRRLAAIGVDAVLVGEHLMREADPGRAIGEKLGIRPATRTPA